MPDEQRIRGGAEFSAQELQKDESRVSRDAHSDPRSERGAGGYGGPVRYVNDAYVCARHGMR